MAIFLSAQILLAVDKTQTTYANCTPKSSGTGLFGQICFFVDALFLDVNILNNKKRGFDSWIAMVLRLPGFLLRSFAAILTDYSYRLLEALIKTGLRFLASPFYF